MLYNKTIWKRNFGGERCWYMNILNIPSYFKELHFLIKHGYNKYALFSPYYYFMEVFSEILKEFKDNLHGCPLEFEDGSQWVEILEEMISLLKDMDEMYEDNWNEFEYIGNNIHKAKEQFFKLFSKYFYDLWD